MKEKIKQWVVMKASVTNPYRKYWSASVTLGMDINGTGNSIEKAYNSLVDEIYNSDYRLSLFQKHIIEKLPWK